MNPVRIGVIGAGGIARGYHLPAFRALDNAQLVALAEIDPEKGQAAAKQFEFEDLYDDYRRILDRDDIDAVALLTCVGTHTEIIPAALDAGKHVFTQKPFALNVADAQMLVEAAERTGLMLVCSFMHRYFPHSVAAKGLLDQGAIGRLEMVRHRNCIGSTYENAVRLLGGVIDIGTHGVDVIRYFTGQDVVKVQAMMDPYVPSADLPVNECVGRPSETVAIMNYEMSGGTLVTHEMHWTQRGGAGAYYAEHYGDYGSLFIKHPMASAPVIYCSGLRSSDEDWAKRASKLEWVDAPLEAQPVNGHLHHKILVDDVANGTRDSATPQDALATVRILDACYRSAQGGGTVELEW